MSRIHKPVKIKNLKSTFTAILMTLEKIRKIKMEIRKKSSKENQTTIQKTTTMKIFSRWRRMCLNFAENGSSRKTSQLTKNLKNLNRTNI